MSAERTEKRRFRLGKWDAILLGVAGVLMLVSVAMSIMQRNGLAPVSGALLLYPPVFALAVLLAWGILALRRAIKKPMIRRIVTVALAVLLLFGFVQVMTYARYVNTISVPHRYSTITSPSGARQLVVMRVLEGDEARVEARRAARYAADPDSGEAIAVEDLCYVYAAYPPALGGFFYHSDADVEGEIRLAYGSGDGTMMVEWLEDETVAHFYVQDPGVSEGGDLTVRF